ncbi:MAG TPA: hypothetical protein VIH42_09365 [Thermoguttaceae bacterium]
MTQQYSAKVKTMYTTIWKRMTARFTIKAWLKLGLIIIGFFASSLLLFFFFPQLLFAWSVSANNLTLYCDQAFLMEDGRNVLELVQAKLSRSPLYSSCDHYAFFICNSKWRQMIFFFANNRAAGLSYYPFTSNVFLRGAALEENRLISPSGKPDIFGRTLDHFIVHEITHVLTGKSVGGRNLYCLPDWIKEGYAEYVAIGNAFNYEEAAQAFLDGDPKMNVPPSAPYLRNILLVAYLLEKQQWSPTKMFEASISQDEVETRLKAELSQKKRQ